MTKIIRWRQRKLRMCAACGARPKEGRTNTYCVQCRRDYDNQFRRPLGANGKRERTPKGTTHIEETLQKLKALVTP